MITAKEFYENKQFENKNSFIDPLKNAVPYWDDNKITFDSPILVSLPGISLKVEVEFIIKEIKTSFSSCRLSAEGNFKVLSVEKSVCFTENAQADINIGRFIELD